MGSIFTDWGVWSKEDEVSLKLTPYELQMYNDPKYGTDSRCLDLKDIAATILHSYANALTQCLWLSPERLPPTHLGKRGVARVLRDFHPSQGNLDTCILMKQLIFLDYLPL